MSATDVRRSDPKVVEPDDDLEVEPAAPPFVRPQWTVRRIGTLLAPAMIYLGIREFGLLVLTWLSSVNGRLMSDVLRSWDGQWFLAIAEYGYDNVPSTLRDADGFQSGETPLAFFPGYPTAVRWLGAIDGPAGIGVVTAAFTLTIVAGVFCAYGLARLGRLIPGGSQRVGLALVALFAAMPMSIVLSMTYSEALFCALAVWSLIGVLERQWVLAGVCCALAGLVRPTAAALVLAVGLAVLVTVLKRRDGWRPWAAGALAPVGLIGYLAWVGVQKGEWDGWFGIQERGWHSGFDGGVATWEYAVAVLDGTRSRESYELVTVALIVVALILAVLCFVHRVQWPLLVYGIGVLAMDLASSGLMHSKARLMLPAFTLLIPVAVALAKRRTSTMVIVLCGLVAASSWFGAYAITAWGYAI